MNQLIPWAAQHSGLEQKREWERKRKIWEWWNFISLPLPSVACLFLASNSQIPSHYWVEQLTEGAVLGGCSCCFNQSKKGQEASSLAHPEVLLHCLPWVLLAKSISLCNSAALQEGGGRKSVLPPSRWASRYSESAKRPFPLPLKPVCASRLGKGTACSQGEMALLVPSRWNLTHVPFLVLSLFSCFLTLGLKQLHCHSNPQLLRSEGSGSRTSFPRVLLFQTCSYFSGCVPCHKLSSNTLTTKPGGFPPSFYCTMAES